MGQVLDFAITNLFNARGYAALQTPRRNAANTAYEWGTAAWLDVANTFTTGPQIFTGGSTVRQSGGVAGTDEVRITHDGTFATFYNPRSSSSIVQFKFSGNSAGTSAFIVATTTNGGVCQFYSLTNSGSMVFGHNAANVLQLNGATNSVGVRSDAAYGFSASTVNGATALDTAIVRAAAGVVALTDAGLTGNPGIGLQARSSTTDNRDRFRLTTAAVDNTDATRKYRAILNVYDTASREVMRGEASGTVPLIGFLGATAVGVQSVGAAATDPATTMDLANALRTALINLGLCTT